jgi:hypothetical protein
MRSRRRNFALEFQLRIDGAFGTVEGQESQGHGVGIPHLAKNERDAPNFLHGALDKATCAPFFKERRIEFAEPTKLLRKSGMWGTLSFVARTDCRADRLSSQTLSFVAGTNFWSKDLHSSLRNCSGKNLLTLLEAQIYELSAPLTNSLVHYGNHG